MQKYEILFLTVPEITQDESETIEKKFDGLVSEEKGSVISYERWGKFELAYPVRKYDYGIYFLTRFEVSDDLKEKLIKKLHDFFQVKQGDLVMRYIIVHLDPNKSLEYKRPESLEEGPARDVDEFLKENKMTGLLNTSTSVNSEKVTIEEEKLEKKEPAKEVGLSEENNEKIVKEEEIKEE